MKSFLREFDTYNIVGPVSSYRDATSEKRVAEKFMPLIRLHSGNQDLAPDDVHLRATWLCNSQQDYYYSRFSPSALDEIAELLPGRPVMRGHRYDQLPVGKFFHAERTTREELRLPRRDNQWVKGLFYLPRDAEGDAIVRRIDQGIYSNTSVGWRCLEASCSLCQNPIEDRNRCPHVPGEVYEDGICDYEFSGVTAVLEASLVFSGGQKDTSLFDPSTASRERRLSLEEFLTAPNLDWRMVRDLKRGFVAEVPELLELTRSRQLRGEVQLVKCSKARFEERTQAARWVRDHEFRADRAGETGENFEFRQFDPSDSRENTRREIELDSGVRAVLCKRKEAGAPPEDEPISKLFEEAAAT